MVALVQAQDGAAPVTTPPPAQPALNRDVGGFGIGVLLGLPTAISVAYRPDEGIIHYAAAFGWGFDQGVLHAHGDVLFRLADLRPEGIPDVHLPVYIGIGPRVRMGDSPYTRVREEVRLGVHVPVGVSFLHDGVPLEAFVELAPGVSFYPIAIGTVDVVLGARYYFP